MARAERAFWLGWTLLAFAVIVAGLVLAWRRGAQQPSWTYLPDESRPEAVVYNAYAAVRQGDVKRFLGYFERSPWGEGGRIARLESYALREGELRVHRPRVTNDHAEVTVSWVRVETGFLWGPEVRVEEQTVRLERVGGRWLIASSGLPFVYPVWEMPPQVLPKERVPPGGD